MGGATITVSDVAATNGIIHVIDQVRGSDAGQQKVLCRDLIKIPLVSRFSSRTGS